MGSRDGREALRFRHYAPDARVIAIEANPELHAKMVADPLLVPAAIETMNLAVSNADGEASFTIFKRNKGTGSLRLKPGREVIATHAVPMRRLDTVVDPGNGRTALWIDVEGCTYEALEGAAGLMHSIDVIHAEIEGEEVFSGQKTAREVLTLLSEKNFMRIDGDVPTGYRGGNVVFLRSDIARRLSIFLPVLAYKCYSHIR